VRPIEIRLLEGPNVYRLEPAVKVEVAVGRRRAWRGERDPGSTAEARLAVVVPAREWPDEVAALAAWTRRLRVEHGERTDGLAVHRGSDPGHWVVAYPWSGFERARTIAEAAVELADRSVTPARSARLTGTQTRLLARWTARIERARTTPPAWVRDPDRTMPIVSISGTNGKSTVSRLISHVLLLGGRHVGTTTSDGVLVDGRMVEPGDWTGPGGAGRVLGRGDVDVAVLETARGGILLRGVGYQSNEVSVLTNVSADHLDLQGVHTLPQLAEVKATICRITRPEGTVVLNADDPYVAAVARRVRAHVAFFSLAADPPAALRRHLATGRRCYLLRGDRLLEVEGERRESLGSVREIPIAIGGLARYNLANALAAAGGARALGATVAQVAEGLRTFRPDPERSPGRLNLFRLAGTIVIVDFAHNEAGLDAVLDVAEGIAAGAAGRAAPITVIVGTAGDRPDDALVGLGRIAARRGQRVAIKETVGYLRGRRREEVVDRLRDGIAEAGCDPEAVPVYESETAALRGELQGRPTAGDGRPGAARVVVLTCHEERDEVLRLLAELGARQVDVAAELTELVPRLQDRPMRD
jgi:cyanophycin synthetase